MILKLVLKWLGWFLNWIPISNSFIKLVLKLLLKLVLNWLGWFLFKNGFALVMKLAWVVGVVSGKKLIGNLLEINKWKLE